VRVLDQPGVQPFPPQVPGIIPEEDEASLKKNPIAEHCFLNQLKARKMPGGHDCIVSGICEIHYESCNPGVRSNRCAEVLIGNVEWFEEWPLRDQFSRGEKKKGGRSGWSRAATLSQTIQLRTPTLPRERF
jgi:hypothetical protein